MIAATYSEVPEWSSKASFSVLGFAGGAFGTYCSIRNAQGPLERAFMIKASIVTWIALLVFLGLLLGLPSPYRFLMWIPYRFPIYIY